MPSVDPGAQVERTGLAWQRTALSGLAVMLALARLIGARSLVAGVVVAVLGLAAAVVALVTAQRRYRREEATGADGARRADGRAAAGLVGLLLIISGGALLYTALVAVR